MIKKVQSSQIPFNNNYQQSDNFLLIHQIITQSVWSYRQDAIIQLKWKWQDFQKVVS